MRSRRFGATLPRGPCGSPCDASGVAIHFTPGERSVPWGPAEALYSWKDSDYRRRIVDGDTDRLAYLVVKRWRTSRFEGEGGQGRHGGPEQGAIERREHAPQSARLRRRPAGRIRAFFATAAAPGRRVRVDVGDAVYELTNRGAGFLSARLLKYKQGEKNFVQLVPPGRPDVRPLYFWGGQTAQKLNEASYQVEGGDLSLSKANPEGTIRFIYRGADGLSAEKALTFRHNEYNSARKSASPGPPGPRRWELSGDRVWAEATATLMAASSRGR